MVIDTSAIIAILEDESEAFRLGKSIEADPVRLVSAGTVLEAAIVATARAGQRGAADLDALLAEAHVEVVPVTADHVRLAREGFVRYGKGRHRAALNFGDLFAYALAKASGQPLLFTGKDFAATDVARVPVVEAR